jgi:polyphosphate kinase
MSETIRVRSQLGRYLEHSRIVRFGHGDVAPTGHPAAGDSPKPLYLIGSADWMQRNLDRRVEVLVPVAHPKHQVWLEHVFESLLDPATVRWELDRDGTWNRRGPERFSDGDGQERFYRWVADRQKR